MTQRTAGKTNTRDPRGWRIGKSYKKSTKRLLRRLRKKIISTEENL